MIHWTPEGETYKTGLNAYWTFLKSGWWIRLAWYWGGTNYYFRYRSYLQPHVIMRKITKV
jgi:hypothetical protein